ncbi:hypothetical protein J661_0111 [Acinetobacter baumannii 1391434]|nr:hypothetical protein J661_0111 [Acinetobacter baumannii 1391434]
MNKLDIKQLQFATYNDDIEDDFSILTNYKKPYLIKENNSKVINKRIQNIK